MITIINGIFLIIVGIGSAVYMPEVCRRHGEPELAVGVSVGGIVTAAIGVGNVMQGVEETRIPAYVFTPPIRNTDNYTTYANGTAIIARAADTITLSGVVSKTTYPHSIVLRMADKTQVTIIEPVQKLLSLED
jgi:hypothetical protein